MGGSGQDRHNESSDPRQPYAQAGRPRIDQEIAQPSVAAGNKKLRQLDSAGECDKPEGQQPGSLGITYTERQTEKGVDEKMFPSVAERSNRPEERRTDGEEHNGSDQQPAPNP